MFCPISTNDFVNLTIKNNPKENQEKLQQAILESIELKKNNCKCIYCGSTIWAVGTAIVGWNGCFTCITGESDNSEDYEIDEVCF